MSVRDRLRRLLDRGERIDDPDEYVEFAVVRLERGPMLLDRLHGAGIDAVGDDAFSVATQVRSDYRVLVRRRDLEAATEVSADP